MLDRMNLYRPVIYGTLIISGLAVGSLYFFADLRVFAIFGAAWLAAVVWALLYCARIGRDTEKQLSALRESLFGAQRDSVAEFPMATMILRETG